MHRVTLKLREFLVEEDGAAATEYAVMLGLVIVVALGAIGVAGQNVNATFGGLGDGVATEAGASQPSGGPECSGLTVNLRPLRAR